LVGQQGTPLPRPRAAAAHSLPEPGPQAFQPRPGIAGTAGGLRSKTALGEGAAVVAAGMGLAQRASAI
jgi:hypothetical protein